jgi:hypothetical protein
MRLCWLLLACASPPKPVPAAATPPRPAHVEPKTGPGARLAAAPCHDNALEVPTAWIDGRTDYEGLFPPLAQGLEERWVFDPNVVCREAFYSGDVEALQSAHPLWSELVAALAGDDKYRDAKVERSAMRVTLRRERHCIYHECKPPLSPPTVTLTACDDAPPPLAPRAVARAVMGYMPSLAGHEPLLDIGKPFIVNYKRASKGFDEVHVTLMASPEEQDAARSFLIEHAFGHPDASIAWAMNSTSKQRSYLFYPPNGSKTVQLQGRSK